MSRSDLVSQYTAKTSVENKSGLLNSMVCALIPHIIKAESPLVHGPVHLDQGTKVFVMLTWKYGSSEA